jgi:hypothetical protein
MKRALLSGLSVSLVLGASLRGQQPAQGTAHHADASVAVRIATTGLGIEVAKLLTGHVGARVGGSFFSASTSKSQSDISYDASLKLHTFAALIDLSPARRGSFHVTGGLVTNPLTITATGQPSSSGTFKINGNTYTSSQVGTLTLQGKFRSASPYLGFGFGTPANTGSALKLLFDVGAVIAKPRILLTATGAASNPQLASDLQAQEDTTQHDVRKYLKVYPVLSLGLAYRF